MSIKRIVCLCTILCFFPAASQVKSDSASDFEHESADSSQRKILTADKIVITISEIPELSGEFNLDESGMVELELIGKIQVAGLTPNAVANLITDLYSKDYLQDPDISVEVSDFSNETDVLELDQTTTPEISQDREETQNNNLLFSNKLDEPFVPEAKTEPQISDSFVPLERFLIEDDINRASTTSPSSSIASLPALVTEPAVTDYIYIQPQVIETEINLAGSIWWLENIENAYIQFVDQTDIAGNTGCNDFFAEYSHKADLINITFIAMTLNQCEQSKESEFQAALDSIRKVKVISSGEIQLLDKENYIVLSLKR